MYLGKEEHRICFPKQTADFSYMDTTDIYQGLHSEQYKYVATWSGESACTYHIS